MIEQELKDILEKTFPNGTVQVVNDSHHHSGHAGSPGTGQSHFSVTVVDDAFVDKNRVQRHQIINNCINRLFSKGLHALSIRAYTHNEYEGMI